MLRIVMLLLFLLSVPVVTAQEADTPLDYVQYKLENGLDVILVEDHTAPTVAVNIWYDVGGADDQAGLTGFAHLFEHMMFQGSAHIAKGEYFERVSEVGGSANAYTSRENTSYYSSLPAHYLPLALWMEADRMASLDVNAENLENQRSVVLEEYQQNYSNQPYTEVVEALRTETFDYEPYRNLVIGEPEDVLSASLENVVAFHELYYVPNNATLVVAGDIDVDTTRQLIDDYFSQIPASEPPPQLPAYTPEESDGEVREAFQDPFASVPGVFIAWSVPPRSDDDYVALEVLARVLSYGNSSRLVQNLQDTGQALAASTLLEGNVGPSLFGLYALPNFNVSVEDIEQALYDELDKIAAEGVPPEELEKVINLTLSSRIIQLETAAGLAESVQDAYFYFDDPDAVYTEIDRLSDVTSEDIQRVIEEYLSEDGRHVYTVEPGGEPPVALEDIEPV
ncbi:MAG: insulinase family protein, partial [Anaerolineae bacterium]|nr:insulinase family protein [Anaerolineae bacterium]